MAREVCNVLNCSTQKGITNPPPNRSLNSDACMFPWCCLQTFFGLWHVEVCQEKVGATASMVGGASRMVLQGVSTTIWCAVVGRHDRANAQSEEIEHIAGLYRAP